MIATQPLFSVKPDTEGFTVYRNDEALQTPRNLPVTVPTQILAEAIAQECGRQGEKMDLRQMPLTQMALTAIDISAHHREDVVNGIMRFCENELVCQRATDPGDLAAEQARVWQPFLDWCRLTYGADLKTGTGIIPFTQNSEALVALRASLEKLDAFHLTGLSEACGTLGSIVLGLALIMGRADARTVFEAAELDHIWQSKKWGDDPVSQARHADIMRDLEMCVKWIRLLK